MAIRLHHAMIAAALVTVLGAAGPEPSPSTPETGVMVEDMTHAHDLIDQGRRKKDPELMFEGARLLLGFSAPGGGDAAGRAAALAILDEIAPLAAGRDELQRRIAALRRAQPPASQCNWKWQCGPSGCQWVQSC